MADVDARTQRPQGEDAPGVLRVRTGDRDAAGEQDAGDPAHPGAADADQVDPLPQLPAARHWFASDDVEHEAGQALVGVGVPGGRAPPCRPPPAAPDR